MNDPVLYLSLSIALWAIFSFITLFENDDDDDNDGEGEIFSLTSIQALNC